MMTLKQGKFYKDGQAYPLEFGNKEQIQLLDRVQALRTDGVLCRGFDDETPDGDIETVTYKYVCMCGHVNTKVYSYEENNLLERERFTCTCNLHYVLEACDFSEFFTVIKLLTPK